MQSFCDAAALPLMALSTLHCVMLDAARTQGSVRSMLVCGVTAGVCRSRRTVSLNLIASITLQVDVQREWTPALTVKGACDL